MNPDNYVDIYTPQNSMVAHTLMNSFAHAIHQFYYQGKVPPVDMFLEMGATHDDFSNLEKTAQECLHVKNVLEESGIADYLRKPDVQKRILSETAATFEQHIKDSGLIPTLGYEDIDDMLRFGFGHAVLKEVTASEFYDKAYELSRDSKFSSVAVRENEPGEPGDHKTTHFIFNEVAHFAEYIIADTLHQTKLKLLNQQG